MSMVPLLVSLARELESDYNQPLSELDHLLDDDFGFGLHPVDIFHRPRSLTLHSRRRHSPYERALQILSKRAAGRHHHDRDATTNGEINGRSSSLIGKNGFQVSMDVAQFKPNELTVKTVDQTVIVEGKHEEREDNHGLVQRHFVRKYKLPDGYNPKDVVSTFSSDGVLTVKAPPPPADGVAQVERIVQIQQTGPAHLSIKPSEQSSNKVVENGSAENMETSK